MKINVVIGKQAKTPRLEHEQSICLKNGNKLTIDIDENDNFSDFEQSLINTINIGFFSKFLLKSKKTIATTFLFGLISVSLGFIEIFQNQFSELFKEFYTQRTFDHISFSLMLVSIILFISIITFLPSLFKTETKDADEIAEKWFNRKKRAISKSKQLSNVLSDKQITEIEIWLHCVDKDSWFLDGFIVEVFEKKKVDLINLNIHQSDLQELSHWLSERKIEFAKIDCAWQIFNNNKDIESCRKFIFRILGEDAEIAWTSFVSSTIVIGQRVYFSPSAFLDISKNFGFNSEKVLNYIQQDYRLFKHVENVNAPLFVTPISPENYSALKNVKDVGVANILLTSKRDREAISYYIAYVNAQDASDKSKAINGIVTLTLENEFYSIFDSWLFSHNDKGCLDELLDFISYESIEEFISLLQISGRYETIYQLLDRLSVFNDPNHQAIRANCLERQGKYEESFEAFLSVNEDRLKKKNINEYIQYLLNHAWAIVSYKNLNFELENVLNLVFEKLDKTLYECYTIIPDQYWHVLNNKATNYENKEDYDTALKYHLQCLNLIGITTKWRSGSYINIAFNYRKLFEKDNNPFLIEEAKKYCKKGYDLKKELGDFDEIPVAVANLAKIALLTTDSDFQIECKKLVDESLLHLKTSGSIKSKDTLLNLKKDLENKIGR